MSKNNRHIWFFFFYFHFCCCCCVWIPIRNLDERKYKYIFWNVWLPIAQKERRRKKRRETESSENFGRHCAELMVQRRRQSIFGIGLDPLFWGQCIWMLLLLNLKICLCSGFLPDADRECSKPEFSLTAKTSTNIPRCDSVIICWPIVFVARTKLCWCRVLLFRKFGRNILLSVDSASSHCSRFVLNLT